MVVRPDHIACLDGRIGGEWASDTQKQLFLAFSFLVTVLRSNQAVVFASIWIGIRFCEYIMRGELLNLVLGYVKYHRFPDNGDEKAKKALFVLFKSKYIS
jgi:hypothetical protein